MNPARLALTAGVAAVLAVGAADARPARVNQVPNGNVFGCATCHNSAFGGDARNAFGRMVEQGFLTEASLIGSVLWGPELAALDADGDGATNGEELLDPEGAWRSSSPSPGDAAAVTKPWDATSAPPPPEPTAVAATTWAKVKATVAGLLE